ncbi:MAG: hypothetical protein CMK07_13725 [Ponticaulis sp.]|nr:hypothetical protein [Ponticaulis sp.]
MLTRLFASSYAAVGDPDSQRSLTKLFDDAQLSPGALNFGGMAEADRATTLSMFDMASGSAAHNFAYRSALGSLELLSNSISVAPEYIDSAARPGEKSKGLVVETGEYVVPEEYINAPPAMINFDDLSGHLDPIPTSYMGLTWSSDWYYMDGPQYGIDNGPNGYTNGTVSAPNVAYNGFAAPVEFSSTTDFNLYSIQLASAWVDNLAVTIQAWDDGVMVDSHVATVDTTGSSLVILNFNSVDRVTFDSGFVSQFALDNLMFDVDPGEIRGRLFNDLNEDGVRQGNESYLSGRTVFIDMNENGLLDEGEATATTNANGLYRFLDVNPGNYTVRQILPDYWAQTSPFGYDFSYVMETSDDPGGPSHVWNPIHTMGTEIFLGDDDYTNVALPFLFPFFEENQTEIYISSNGFLTFSASSASTYTNTSLPDASAPDGMIAAYWDDLDPSSDGRMHYYHDVANDRFIIQVLQVPNFGTTNIMSYQTILYEDGTIEYQYRVVQEDGDGATIGIENISNTEAVQYSFNEDGAIHNQMAITFTPTYTPTDPKGVAQDVTVEPGEIAGDNDFGSINVSGTTGNVTGRVWHDWNENGLYNSNLEPVMEDIFVFVDENGNGRWDIGEGYDLTNQNGIYRITSIDPGSYDVYAEMPDGTWERWHQTSPVSQPLSQSVDTGPELTVADRKAMMTAIAADQGKGVSIEADFSLDHVANQLIVKLNQDSASAQAVNSLMESMDATVLKSSVTMGIEVWQINGASLESALETLNASAAIDYAELDYIRSVDYTSVDFVPNDTRFDELWGMNNTGQTGGTPDADIDAVEAWDLATGSSSIIVGVIDTGIDYTHPDLVNNMWINTGEIAGNGIDDDGNGYVDDIYGFDWVNNDGDPFDDNEHGTHVGGTIGGEGNNSLGVAGVNHDVSLMALKFLNASGSGSTSDAIFAVEYATMMGANLTNNSWGGGGFSQGLYDAIEAAGLVGDALFIAAAGNHGSNNDTFDYYPANYDLDNVITVAATDHNDLLAGFSGYGPVNVDLAAPGVSILSSVPGGGYASFNGTSMATPHVAGAIALMLSVNPGMSFQEAKAHVMATVDPLANLNGVVGSGGRLNLFNAIDQLGPGPVPHTVDIFAGQTDNNNNFGIAGGATGIDDDILGTGAGDVIDGLAGDDIIDGDSGEDTLLGNNGDDILLGGANDDFLDGGRHNDILDGGEGDDIMLGDLGIDLLIGSPGADNMNGGGQTDTVDYSGSADSVAVILDGYGIGGFADGDSLVDIENAILTDSHDMLFGNNSNNIVWGGIGQDYIVGLGGSDILYGEFGHDTLLGNTGNDILEGGRHDDYLEGGLHADTFLYRGITHHDTIGDYSKTQGDTLWLADVTRFADLTIANNSDGDAVVSWNSGANSITLIGHDAADVRANWFTFGSYTGPAAVAGGVETNTDPLTLAMERYAQLDDTVVTHVSPIDGSEWQIA